MTSENRTTARNDEPELVLHIGAPKTGTTAIQLALEACARPLLEHDVLYPDVGLRGHGHHDLAFLSGGGYPPWASRGGASLAGLVQQLNAALAAPERSVVLSSENFYLQPAPGVLREAIESAESGRRVRVLAYVRRQDHLAISWYNQAVKAQGFAGTFEECLAATGDLWDFEARLKPWCEVFGDDAVEVRVYEREELVGGDAVSDFLATLGLPPNALEVPAGRPNTRLCRELLEFQRQVNRLPLEVERKRRFHREWIALTEESKDRELFDDTPVVGPAGRRALLARYAASNGRLAERFFGREELFREPAPDGPEPSPWAGPDPRALQLALGWLLARS